MEKSEDSDFRNLLQKELVRRCKSNPRYSMRAFAKLLQIDHSSLSRLIRGKRKLTGRQILKLGKLLGLSDDKIKHYQKFLANDFEKISLDHFKIISEWFHFAIFELVTLKTFKPEGAWISKRLGISANDAEAAMSRLQRVGYLKKEGSEWKQSTPLLSTTSFTATNEALMQHQKDLLKLSATSIETVPLSLRDQSAVVFAINTQQIGEAKEMIKKFRRKLCTHLQSNFNRNAVYQLQVSFFPVTQSEEIKS